MISKNKGTGFLCCRMKYQTISGRLSVAICICLFLQANAQTQNSNCPPVPNNNAQCIRYENGCKTDMDCSNGTICCAVTCGINCVDSTNMPLMSFICPPYEIVPIDICARRGTLNECDGDDSRCPSNRKCCPEACGGSRCLGPTMQQDEPMTTPSPVCPPFDEVPIEDCAARGTPNECSGDDSNCPDGQTCCEVECGGSVCSGRNDSPPTESPVCPTFEEVPIEDCAARATPNECSGDDSNCPAGQTCCEVECGGSVCRGLNDPPPPESPVCPPFEEVPIEVCARRGTPNMCSHDDSNCPAGQKCCRVACGGSVCNGPIFVIPPPPPSDVCPPFKVIPLEDCAARGTPNECSGDDVNCPAGQTCCEVECGGSVCSGRMHNNFSRPGVCLAPPRPTPPDFCADAKVVSNCRQDSDCQDRTQKCCLRQCGAMKCTTPHTMNRPGCPPINLDLRCIVFNQQCNADRDCADGSLCCFQPNCGTTCNPQVFCPAVSCRAQTPDQCYRRVFRTVNGMRCEICPEAVLCENSAVCEKGEPLPNVDCRLQGPEVCPNGYFCDNGRCCMIPCQYGLPHPMLFCGMARGTNNCPAGYSCKAHPADAYFACCPDGSDICPYDPTPSSYCGSFNYECRDDNSCLRGEKCCKQGCYYKCVKAVKDV